MRRWHGLQRSWILLVCLGTAVALTACGPHTLVVGLEPTPTLTPLPTPVVREYVNNEFGFTFRYPETWTLAERPQSITLRQGDLALAIAYGWASHPGFRPLGGRTGMPAGDFVYGGRISFLETMIPARVLKYERKAKMVLYGDTSLVEAGELAFSIWMGDADGAETADLDIPERAQAAAKEILASFERIEAEGKPPALAPTEGGGAEQMPTPSAEMEEVIYANDEYDLAFLYPPSWSLEEIPAGQEVARGVSAPAVHLTRDGLRLVIEFKRKGDDSVLGASGLPAGDLEEGGTVTVLGRDVRKQVVVYQEKVKLVFLRAELDDMALYVQLEEELGAETAYETVDIAESAQSELDGILSSLHRTGELKTFGPETLTYESVSHGFSFEYPASWTLQEAEGEEVEDGVRLADAVVLRQGPFAIVVQYRRKSDPAQIAWGGDLVPGGLGYAEAVLGARVKLLGEEAHKHLWEDEDGTKAIAVSTTGGSTDLLVSITLADGSVRLIQDPEAVVISDSAVEALDQVLSSFALTE